MLFPYFRPVFKDNFGNIDRESRFSPLFRQDSSKISTDDLIKLVTDFRRLDQLHELVALFDRKAFNGQLSNSPDIEQAHRHSS